jgi:hypothetical protein
MSVFISFCEKQFAEIRITRRRNILFENTVTNYWFLDTSFFLHLPYCLQHINIRPNPALLQKIAIDLQANDLRRFNCYGANKIIKKISVSTGYSQKETSISKKNNCETPSYENLILLRIRVSATNIFKRNIFQARPDEDTK